MIWFALFVVVCAFVYALWVFYGMLQRLRYDIDNSIKDNEEAFDFCRQNQTRIQKLEEQIPRKVVPIRKQ